MMGSIINGLFGSRIITVTSDGNLGGREDVKVDEIDRDLVRASGRGPPGPEPEIPRGLPSDCGL